MTHKSKGLRYLARCTTLVAIAVTSAALALTSAAAQQERSQRSDKSSGRDDSTTSSDQSTQRDQSDESTQTDQQRRDQQRRSDQSSDRTGQDRTSQDRASQDRDQSRQQYGREQGQQYQGQQSRGQYREASREQYSEQSGRDQFREQSQTRGQSGRGGEASGITFDQQQQGQGLTVRDVQQGTSAAQAGLRAGDQILSVGGRSVGSQQQFLSQLSSQQGRQVPVVIFRNGRQYTVHLTADQLGGQQGQHGQHGQQEGDVAWLGVMLQEGQGNQQGAQVTQIYPAGPAARAGLRSGDVITSVDGERVEDSASLIEAIENHQPGGRAQLTITRNNQQMNVPVTLGSREAFAWRGGDEQWGGQYTSSQSGQGDSRGGQSGQDDHYSSLPPFAMQLEHERRMYEQHQRIETRIAELQDEVRQLRELIQQQQRR